MESVGERRSRLATRKGNQECQWALSWGKMFARPRSATTPKTQVRVLTFEGLVLDVLAGEKRNAHMKPAPTGSAVSDRSKLDPASGEAPFDVTASLAALQPRLGF